MNEDLSVLGYNWSLLPLATYVPSLNRLLLMWEVCGACLLRVVSCNKNHGSLYSTVKFVNVHCIDTNNRKLL